MIYPKKKNKVRSFSIGGAMGSLFDNPGAYLGIQYVPTAVETPDIEGLQYLFQQDEARRMQEQEQAAKAKPNMETLREALKGVHGLDGETESFISGIESQFNSWHQKYNTPDKMLSPEALAEKARLDRNIMVGVSKLKNSADEYKSSYDRSQDVLGDVYTDGGNIMLQSTEDPRMIEPVSIEEYFSNPSRYEGKRVMKNDDVFSWRRRFRPMGMTDGISVDQYSEKQTREYINDHFKKIGTDTRSIEGAGAYAAILAQAGIDPENFTSDDIKVKVENGELNIQRLYGSFVNTLDHKVLKSLKSAMLSRGENPYEMVEVPGQEEKVSNIHLRLHEILTGVRASHGSKIEIKGANDGEGPASDVLTNFMNRNVNLRTLVQNDPVLSGQLGTRTMFNAVQGKAVTVDALAVPNITLEDKERLYGRPIAFHRISDPQNLYFEGKPVMVGREINNQDDSEYYFSGREPTVVTYDVKDAQGNDMVHNVLEIEIVVNEDGLSQFGLSPNDIKKEKTGMAAKISNDELKALPGMTDAEYDNLKKGMFSFSDNYVLRVQMPLADHAGHGGKSPGKASDGINSRTRAIYEKQKKAAMQKNNEVSAEMQTMLNFTR